MSDTSKSPSKNPELHSTRAPEGYVLKGVSTLNDSKGRRVAQWVKTTRVVEPAEIAAIYRDACKLLKTEHAPAAAPAHTSDELCCVYPLGDPHFGMLAWWRETGGKSWDLKIAAESHLSAMRELVSVAPSCEIAVLANLGDLIHADGYKGQTFGGTQVDTDGRWPKILRAATAAMIGMVDILLTKHSHVVVENVRGNHDEQSSVAVNEILRAHFRLDTRVTVRDNVRIHSYLHFGTSLFGFHHGDKTKSSALPLLMATDQPQLWGQTVHRNWYSGHIHHETNKEFPGCSVETFGTLAPQDAWHAGQGYRSRQRARVDVWHKTRGRIARYEVCT